MKRWVEPQVRDVHHWEERAELGRGLFIRALEVGRNKFSAWESAWESRYGKENFHNGKVHRDFWLLEWERAAIVKYYSTHPRRGYRALTYHMMDEDIVAVSPATVYRVLKSAGMLSSWNQTKQSLKGTGFHQPISPHEHWHVDISYINICGTFYYFIAVLDGCSRYVIHWDIRESMTEQDVKLVIQKARIISDNGPQFISKDFKEFIRISGMTHVRTSPYYPQANGKFERFNRTIKSECIRPKSPVSLEDARRIAGGFTQEYNHKRLHSAIGFVTPRDRLTGKHIQIFEARDRKLEAARAKRKADRENSPLAA